MVKLTSDTLKCHNCGKLTRGRGWFLRGYYGLDGSFCAKCYDLVSHDSFDRPRNPAEHKKILRKFQRRRIMGSNVI